MHMYIVNKFSLHRNFCTMFTSGLASTQVKMSMPLQHTRLWSLIHWYGVNYLDMKTHVYVHVYVKFYHKAVGFEYSCRFACLIL